MISHRFPGNRHKTTVISAIKARLMIIHVTAWLLLSTHLTLANEAASPTLDQNQKHDHKPILLYVSRSDCHFCHLLEAEILKPLIRSGKYSDTIIIRNLVLDSSDPVEDFKGQQVSPSELAQLLAADLTPTLLFVDANGRELASRIVGYQRSEFYFYYLEEALDNAIAALAGP